MSNLRPIGFFIILKKTKRVYINGRLSAFQAEDMSSNLIIRIKGGITQLVECVLCKHEVIGSIPITST